MRCIGISKYVISYTYIIILILFSEKNHIICKINAFQMVFGDRLEIYRMYFAIPQ